MGICPHNAARFKRLLSYFVPKSGLEPMQGGVTREEATSARLVKRDCSIPVGFWRALVLLQCNLSTLSSAAAACGGTPWQEAHLIQTTFLVYVSRRPIATGSMTTNSKTPPT